ncbi:MAG: transglycosylase domain-containing protein [Pseudomonadota bacterium]|nr:transglycosylase domain-containing protein [Pseudomonadota bacterium]
MKKAFIYSVNAALLALIILPIYLVLINFGEIDRESIALTPDRLALSSEVYDRNGIKISEYGLERRYFVPITQMPSILIEAFLSAEDKDFFNHKGISYPAILRAVFANIFSMQIKQGGSTITQQLARLLFLDRQRTWIRKSKEAQIAWLLEKKYSKGEILTYYLNAIYLGNGAYGVEAASRSYFRKSVQELNLAEAAMLAGLPKAPSMLAPHKNYRAAKQRQAIVLQRMREDNIISESRYQQTLKQEIKVAKNAQPAATAPYFSDQIRNVLAQHFGLMNLSRKGYQIHTSLDSHLQQTINQRLRSFKTAAEVQVAVAVLDANSSEVLALQGGSGYQTTQFNRALATHRRSHQLLLPFMLAELSDAYSYGVDRIDPLFRKFYQSVLQPQASNLQELVNGVGAGSMQKIFNALEVDFDQAQSSLQFNLMQMASAFAVFANQGVQRSPHYVKKITSYDHKPLFQHQGAAGKRLFSDRAAFIVSSLLRTYLRQHNLTGYTAVNSDKHDSWFVGYDAKHVYSIWVGAERGRVKLTGNPGLALFNHLFRDKLQLAPTTSRQDVAYVSMRLPIATDQSFAQNQSYVSLPVPL